MASKVAGTDWGARLPLMGAALVALWAAKGSASALLEIATTAKMSETTALPVALDMTGLVAALVIRRRRRDWLAWFTLVATVGISTAMQVMTAPADLVSQAAHGVVPLAALVSFELAMRVAVRDVDEHQADELVAVPEPVAVPEVEQQVLPAVRPQRKRVALEELVPVAETVAAELVGAGRPLTWQSLRDGIRDAGYACGDERARTLVTFLRTSGVGA